MPPEAPAANSRPARVERDWLIAPPHPHRDVLVQSAGVPALLAQLLLNRGIDSPAVLREYFDPRLSRLHPPESLPNAVLAAQRLAEAARRRRRIVIYGDYDVDGVTASAILWHALRLAGVEAHCYLPSRFEEGYGLNGDALRRLAADGAEVVISVDCGITAVAEARLAAELGLELIITDHHQPRSTLPENTLIVHPSAVGPSPNPDLCGAGVAFKIAWAFGRCLTSDPRVAPEFRDYLMDAAAFAALGLIADIAPLTGENRVLAACGLRQLCASANPGVRALLDAAGLRKKAAVDDFDVGFTLAPRLNAVGRLGHAREAVELLTQADAERAREIAATLNQLNTERQGIERNIIAQAEQLVRERGFDRDPYRAIVLASNDWHTGVIGIVASRIVDKFHRPTVLIALENGVGQGSGRSIRHFPLHEALAACGGHLLSHGGHAMAAGLRVQADQIEPFTRAFQAEAGRRLTPQDLRPKLHIDDEVELSSLTPTTIAPLNQMAPFGIGNARPRLATTEVELSDEPRRVGSNGQHVQFSVRQGRTYRRAVAFNQPDLADALREQRRMRLAFEPLINDWNNQQRVELKVIDWKW